MSFIKTVSEHVVPFSTLSIGLHVAHVSAFEEVKTCQIITVCNYSEEINFARSLKLSDTGPGLKLDGLLPGTTRCCIH